MPDADPAQTEILAFGAFELDVSAMMLRRSGARVKLRAQPFRLLTLFARSAGVVVTREEIRAHLWDPTTHVDFARGINACVKAIRASLGDDAHAPRFIETLPGVGYRFVAVVERRGSDASGAPAAAVEAEAEAPRASTSPTDTSDSETEVSAEVVEPSEARSSDGVSSTEVEPSVPAPSTSSGGHRASARVRDLPERGLGRWLPVIAVGLVASVVGLGFVLDSSSGSASVAAEPIESADEVEGPPRLAVLPFKESGRGPDDIALGDALAWEIISELNRRYSTRLEVLAIQSAVRMAARDAEPTALAAELRVDHVLQGTIVHGPRQIRLTMALVRASDGIVLWGDTRDLDPGALVKLQAEVGDEVAHALALELLPRPASAEASSTPPAAYAAYLEGRTLLAGRISYASCSEGAKKLDEAIALAPEFASAHAARARTYQQCPIAKAAGRYSLAREAAQRALELDPLHVEAHVLMGKIALYSTTISMPRSGGSSARWSSIRRTPRPITVWRPSTPHARSTRPPRGRWPARCSSIRCPPSSTSIRDGSPTSVDSIKKGSATAKRPWTWSRVSGPRTRASCGPRSRRAIATWPSSMPERCSGSSRRIRRPMRIWTRNCAVYTVGC